MFRLFEVKAPHRFFPALSAGKKFDEALAPEKAGTCLIDFLRGHDKEKDTCGPIKNHGGKRYPAATFTIVSRKGIA